ncbi:uncharacterized protein HGUI_02978 [Hanseniaspora guilliermondii]|uniref:Uncharacterized protein n=1 Tax=Hanseniaspora guilliermondii TaxID=56406 RepID=A0A1L0B308_9ASCO|nr:uncharacterized protein HGUI_02978 [Hanseniaspora guilliermondii]
MKRYNHNSSHNLKNVPPYKNITDYIIHRNVVENEEFKVWKDHWVTMFQSIAMFKPLEFKKKHFESALEKYEEESYRNIIISSSLQNGKSLYVNFNDDQYIYKIDIDFDILNQNELKFWTCEKIGYIKPNDQVLQIEVLDKNRILVLTKLEVQVYNTHQIIQNLDVFINLLELQKYEQIDTSLYGSLSNINLSKRDAFILNFYKLDTNNIILTTGDIVSIENNCLKIKKNIDLNDDKEIYLSDLVENDFFYSFEGHVIHKKSQILTENNIDDLLLDIDAWNESIAEFEEDKLEEITAFSVNTANSIFMLTSHVNGDINLWNISNGKIVEKTQKILKVSHSLIQNRELLVDRTPKTKSDGHLRLRNGKFFNKYDYKIVDNFHSSKRLNQLDENGVEWIYPYINSLQWVSPSSFVSMCSRSGYIYHWDILPFIKHDLDTRKSDNVEKWSNEDIQEKLLTFKQSVGGRRRDRSPKYLEEAFIKTRQLHSFGFLNDLSHYYAITNDGSIILYNFLK